MENEIRSLVEDKLDNATEAINNEIATLRNNPIARELKMINSWIWLREK
jgi:hypothetical protein